jgi:hypothetical protein
VVAAAALVLGLLVPVPSTLAQELFFEVSVAPTCVRPGVATRIVITGSGWINNQPVALSAQGAAMPPQMVTARTSPFGQASGSFTITLSVTATSRFRILASQVGQLNAQSSYVEPQTTCKEQISIQPPCRTAPGVAPVTVSGSGFGPGTALHIVADPFGNAERAAVNIDADESGNVGVTIEVGFAGAAVPIVVTWFAQEQEKAALAFLEPCPPPQTTAPTVTRPPQTTIPPTVPGTTTSTTVPGPGDPPPGDPPITIPTPGANVKVSISPYTVRPGRCVVLVVSAAPPGLSMVARFEDGVTVSRATGPTGEVVLSLCHSHDSGVPLGPVKVLIGVGSAPPLPVFTVLRVPARPQPPMLQAGADGRRS